MYKNETQFWKWVIKNLHVIIVVKFTSEELIVSYTEKKVISYIRNIMN